MLSQTKRLVLWYALLSKRFLKRRLFALLLLLTPLLVLGMRMLSQGDSGVLHVLLYCEEDGVHTEGLEVIEALLSQNGVVLYEQVTGEGEGRERVATGEADCLWIIPADVSGAISNYYAGGASSIVTVLVRSDTVSTRLVREQLSGVLYPTIAYLQILTDISSQEYFSALSAEEIAEALSAFYAANQVTESLMQFAYLDDTLLSEADTEVSYLTLPLRGLLSLLLLLCALAVTLFYLQDEEDGRFSWMRLRHEALLPFFYVLTGTLLSAAAVFISLLFSGSFTTWQAELPLLLLYAVSVSGFCQLLRLLCRSIRALGACIPLLLLVSLVLCPVFLSLNQFPLVQYLLPTYYYLNSLHSPSMALRMLLYTALLCSAGFSLEVLRLRRRHRL